MAAAGSVVSVLAPNGRRVTTKVSPGSALLQVLEEICRKQNFNPDEYDLKFQRTVLDLSLQWRFANLPNNAKLEMVPVSRPRTGTESKVRIALQLEDGSRLQEEFLSSHTLWELLGHFSQTRASMEQLCRESTPVCVYMRDEVTGEDALKRTTLKSLGLTGGSGNIRFLIKKATFMSQSGLGSPRGPACTSSTQVEPGVPLQPMTTYSAQTDLEKPQGGISSSQSDVGRPLHQINTPSSQRDLGRLQTIAASAEGDTGTSHPLSGTPSGESDLIEPRLATRAHSEQTDLPLTSSRPSAVERDKNNVHMIVGTGGAIQTSKSHSLKAPSNHPPPQEGYQNWLLSQSKAIVEEANIEDLLASNLEKKPSKLKEGMAISCSPPIVPFLGGGQRLGGSSGDGLSSVAEEPQPLNLRTSLASPGGPSRPKKSKTFPELEGSLREVPRDVVVCHLDLEDPVRKEWLASCPEDLPDDFFDITVDDVRKRLAQLKSDRQRLTEMPLMTNALREAQKKEKLERYPKTVLRVVFPDRYILQGFFHPNETIRALMDFVKSHLEDATIPFYMFVTPPRVVLNDEGVTLFQANLFPAAVVHFGSSVGKEHYLRQTLLDSIVPPSHADLLVARSMPLPSATAPPSLPEASAIEEVDFQAVPDVPEAVPQASHAPRRDPAKVPKWLKLPGKK